MCIKQRQLFLAQSLHSAGSNQRHRRAAFLKLCCFPGRGREGIGGTGSPRAPAGEELSGPLGSRVWSENPACTAGLLVT